MLGREVEAASRDEDDAGVRLKHLVFPKAVVALVNRHSL